MDEVVSNVKIYNVKETGIASGYPMVADIKDATFDEKRIIRLGQNEGGHDNFLNGILVSFDLTLTCKAWMQAERYKFLDIISSQSTMHRITDMKIADGCIGYTDSIIASRAEVLKERYLKSQKEEDFLTLIYSFPIGLKLTAKVTTNYRCLKNIYFQRALHRLPEWKEAGKWIETLPYMDKIIEAKKKKNAEVKELRAENKRLRAENEELHKQVDYIMGIIDTARVKSDAIGKAVADIRMLHEKRNSDEDRSEENT